jgi:hypothetical protein
VLVTRGLSEMHMNVHPLAKHSPRLVPLVVVCCVVLLCGMLTSIRSLQPNRARDLSAQDVGGVSGGIPEGD